MSAACAPDRSIFKNIADRVAVFKNEVDKKKGLECDFFNILFLL